eukprot:TRINITY_DN1870_c6_g1_i1.p1 TRINITY_DN1870_c6_g1~~TRINITY_DN1870_c6_g1_i1.p1  ORF type:complete len:185 (-),score=18.85 TRINITY_DN1870_c6_g1_i1:72-626(-)
MAVWGKTLPRGFSATAAAAWSERIEKEDKFMVSEYHKSKEKEKQKEKRRLRHERHRSRPSSRTDGHHHRHDSHREGSEAGSRRAGTAPSGLSSMSRHNSCPSVASSALSRTSSSSRVTAVPPLPKDLRGVGRFHFTEQDLMRLRVEEDSFGRMPKMIFKVRKNEAHWVPGSRSYIDYEPHFSLE